MDDAICITTLEVVFIHLIADGTEENEAENIIQQLQTNYQLGLDRRYYLVDENLITLPKFRDSIEQEYNIKFIPIPLY